uniref:Uncharacterized protein n=1 Tax=Ditylenchus dipsaci TaxID=166011 RepID=A0A915EGM0_9BILA
MNLAGCATRLANTNISFYSSSTTIFAIMFVAVCLLRVSQGASPFCRTCRGSCKPNETIASAENFTDPTSSEVTDDLINEVVDNDTSKPINSSSSSDRPKRQSYVERRTCSSKFQLEALLIPFAIMMIPVALCSLLMCVFCCGPEDSRGKVPEKMFGMKIGSQKRKDCADEDELEYKDGYVRRIGSQKTRFATNVQIIEPERRRSSVVDVGNIENRQTREIGEYLI